MCKLCTTKPNYKGPAVGAWTLGLALEFCCGMLLIVLGSYGGEYLLPYEGSLTPSEEADVLLTLDMRTNAYSLMLSFGWLHVLFALASLAFVTLGLFICGIFLCPLCILAIFQGTFCVVSTFTCAAYLRGYSNILAAASGEDSSAFSNGDLYFTSMYWAHLLAAAALAFASCVAYTRALRIKANDSVNGTLLMLYGISLCAAVTVMFLCAGGQVSAFMALGGLWLVGVIVLSVAMNMMGCCLSTVVCNILGGAGFAAVAVLGFISLCTVSNKLVNGIETEFDNIKLIIDDGGSLVVNTGLTAATTIFSTFAAVYNLRAMVCCVGK